MMRNLLTFLATGLTILLWAWAISLLTPIGG